MTKIHSFIKRLKFRYFRRPEKFCIIPKNRLHQFVDTSILSKNHRECDIVFHPEFEEWLKSNGPWHIEYKIPTQSYEYSGVKIWFMNDENLVAFGLSYAIYP